MLKAFGIDKYIKKLFHRGDCSETWLGIAKDLTILKVPLKDVILIDVTHLFYEFVSLI